MGDCSLREAGGAGSLEEVALLSTEGFCDPGEVRGKGSCPGRRRDVAEQDPGRWS